MAESLLTDWHHDGWTNADWASIEFLSVELADVMIELAKGVNEGPCYAPRDLSVLARLTTEIGNRLLNVSSRYA